MAVADQARAAAVGGQAIRIRRNSVARSNRSTIRTTSGMSLRLGSMNNSGSMRRTSRPRVRRSRAAGRHDVLYPLDVGAVGKRKDVPVTASEDVDRRVVCPTTLPSPVLQDPEARQPAREAPRDRVEDVRRKWSDGSHPGRRRGHRRLVIEASLASFGGSLQRRIVSHHRAYACRPPGSGGAFATTSITAHRRPTSQRSTDEGCAQFSLGILLEVECFLGCTGDERGLQRCQPHSPVVQDGHLNEDRRFPLSPGHL